MATYSIKEFARKTGQHYNAVWRLASQDGIPGHYCKKGLGGYKIIELDASGHAPVNETIQEINDKASSQVGISVNEFARLQGLTAQYVYRMCRNYKRPGGKKGFDRLPDGWETKKHFGQIRIFKSATPEPTLFTHELGELKDVPFSETNLGKALDYSTNCLRTEPPQPIGDLDRLTDQIPESKLPLNEKMTGSIEQLIDCLGAVVDLVAEKKALQEKLNSRPTYSVDFEKGADAYQKIVDHFRLGGNPESVVKFICSVKDEHDIYFSKSLALEDMIRKMAEAAGYDPGLPPECLVDLFRALRDTHSSQLEDIRRLKQEKTTLLEQVRVESQRVRDLTLKIVDVEESATCLAEENERLKATGSATVGRLLQNLGLKTR